MRIKTPMGGFLAGVALLVSIPHLLCARDNNDTAHKSVQLAISVIEKSAATYVDKRECFSCHHQALTMMALNRARRAGFKVGEESISMQSRFTIEYFKDRIDRLPKGQGVPGGPYSAGYALTGLAAAGEPGNKTTDALIQYLLNSQNKDGSWHIRTHRPPLEDSHFTATALAIKGLGKFEDPEKRAKPIQRAVEWLIKAEPKTTEDHVFRVFGLQWGNAKKDSNDAAGPLLKLQREDQGWAQMPNMESDAYATGQALVALKESGLLEPGSPQFKGGIRWLVEHQEPDGSWHVKTRSKPIQKYFESDFPHGKDQFISISATCWAEMALLP
ncbi:MAG: terpene cyclase/mutase family protein [Opitutae bacterium]|nr:terpene cyclase/mutase family protein [Opitutae bacterium]